MFIIKFKDGTQAKGYHFILSPVTATMISWYDGDNEDICFGVIDQIDKIVRLFE